MIYTFGRTTILKKNVGKRKFYAYNNNSDNESEETCSTNMHGQFWGHIVIDN